MGRIVCGINNVNLREKLLRTDDLTLYKSINLCRRHEISASQLKEQDVDLIRTKTSDRRPQNKTYNQTSHKQKSNSAPNNNPCRNCGVFHVRKKETCPAFGKQCHACEKSLVCLSNNLKPQQRKVHEIDINSDEDGSSSDENRNLFVGKISVNDQSHWVEQIIIDNHTVSFKLDTGSEANILPHSDFKHLHNRQLRESKVKLVSYTKHKLTLNIKKTDIVFQVLDGVDPILGRDTCLKLGLVQRIQSVDSRIELSAPNDVIA